MNLEYIEMNEINNAKKADKILQSVCASFKRIPIRNPEVLNRNNHRLTFNVNLEIQEEENSKFIPVPFDKNSFKLRRNFNKKVAVSVTQSTGLVLPVERLGTLGDIPFSQPKSLPEFENFSKLIFCQMFWTIALSGKTCSSF